MQTVRCMAMTIRKEPYYTRGLDILVFDWCREFVDRYGRVDVMN